MHQPLGSCVEAVYRNAARGLRVESACFEFKGLHCEINLWIPSLCASESEHTLGCYEKHDLDFCGAKLYY